MKLMRFNFSGVNRCCNTFLHFKKPFEHVFFTRIYRTENSEKLVKVYHKSLINLFQRRAVWNKNFIIAQFVPDSLSKNRSSFIFHLKHFCIPFI